MQTHPLVDLALKRGLLAKTHVPMAMERYAKRADGSMAAVLREMGLPEKTLKALETELMNALRETQLDPPAPPKKPAK